MNNSNNNNNDNFNSSFPSRRDRSPTSASDGRIINTNNNINNIRPNQGIVNTLPKRTLFSEIQKQKSNNNNNITEISNSGSNNNSALPSQQQQQEFPPSVSQNNCNTNINRQQQRYYILKSMHDRSGSSSFLKSTNNTNNAQMNENAAADVTSMMVMMNHQNNTNNSSSSVVSNQNTNNICIAAVAVAASPSVGIPSPVYSKDNPNVKIIKTPVQKKPTVGVVASVADIPPSTANDDDVQFVDDSKSNASTCKTFQVGEDHSVSSNTNNSQLGDVSQPFSLLSSSLDDAYLNLPPEKQQQQQQNQETNDNNAAITTQTRTSNFDRQQYEEFQEITINPLAHQIWNKITTVRHMLKNSKENNNISNNVHQQQPHPQQDAAATPTTPTPQNKEDQDASSRRDFLRRIKEQLGSEIDDEKYIPTEMCLSVNSLPAQRFKERIIHEHRLQTFFDRQESLRYTNDLETYRNKIMQMRQQQQNMNNNNNLNNNCSPLMPPPPTKPQQPISNAIKISAVTFLDDTRPPTMRSENDTEKFDTLEREDKSAPLFFTFSPTEANIKKRKEELQRKKEEQKKRKNERDEKQQHQQQLTRKNSSNNSNINVANIGGGDDDETMMMLCDGSLLDHLAEDSCDEYDEFENYNDDDDDEDAGNGFPNNNNTSGKSWNGKFIIDTTEADRLKQVFAQADDEYNKQRKFRQDNRTNKKTKKTWISCFDAWWRTPKLVCDLDAPNLAAEKLLVTVLEFSSQFSPAVFFASPRDDFFFQEAFDDVVISHYSKKNSNNNNKSSNANQNDDDNNHCHQEGEDGSSFQLPKLELISNPEIENMDVTTKYRIVFNDGYEAAAFMFELENLFDRGHFYQQLFVPSPAQQQNQQQPNSPTFAFKKKPKQPVKVECIMFNTFTLLMPMLAQYLIRQQRENEELFAKKHKADVVQLKARIDNEIARLRSEKRKEKALDAIAAHREFQKGGNNSSDNNNNNASFLKRGTTLLDLTRRNNTRDVDHDDDNTCARLILENCYNHHQPHSNLMTGNHLMFLLQEKQFLSDQEEIQIRQQARTNVQLEYEKKQAEENLKNIRNVLPRNHCAATDREFFVNTAIRYGKILPERKLEYLTKSNQEKISQYRQDYEGYASLMVQKRMEQMAKEEIHHQEEEEKRRSNSDLFFVSNENDNTNKNSSQRRNNNNIADSQLSNSSTTNNNSFNSNDFSSQNNHQHHFLEGTKTNDNVVVNFGFPQHHDNLSTFFIELRYMSRLLALPQLSQCNNFEKNLEEILNCAEETIMLQSGFKMNYMIQARKKLASAFSTARRNKSKNGSAVPVIFDDFNPTGQFESRFCNSSSIALPDPSIIGTGTGRSSSTLLNFCCAYLLCSLYLQKRQELERIKDSDGGILDQFWFPKVKLLDGRAKTRDVVKHTALSYMEVNLRRLAVLRPLYVVLEHTMKARSRMFSKHDVAPNSAAVIAASVPTPALTDYWSQVERFFPLIIAKMKLNGVAINYNLIRKTDELVRRLLQNAVQDLDTYMHTPIDDPNHVATAAAPKKTIVPIEAFPPRAPFNPGSADDVVTALLAVGIVKKLCSHERVSDVKFLRPRFKTKKRQQLSTTQDNLTFFAGLWPEIPLPAMIMRIRRYSKLRETYFYSMFGCAIQPDGWLIRPDGASDECLEPQAFALEELKIEKHVEKVRKRHEKLRQERALLTQQQQYPHHQREDFGAKHNSRNDDSSSSSSTTGAVATSNSNNEDDDGDGSDSDGNEDDNNYKNNKNKFMKFPPRETAQYLAQIVQSQTSSASLQRFSTIEMEGIATKTQMEKDRKKREEQERKTINANSFLRRHDDDSQNLSSPPTLQLNQEEHQDDDREDKTITKEKEDAAFYQNLVADFMRQCEQDERNKLALHPDRETSAISAKDVVIAGVDPLPFGLSRKAIRSLHANWVLDGTESGRFCCDEPNLQNIPRVDSNDPDRRYQRACRRAFVPLRDDHLIVTFDYNQIELRVLANYSRETALISALTHDDVRRRDIHRSIASQILNKPFDAITDDERRHAKSIVFASLYGMGVKSLADKANISEERARQFQRDFELAYPMIEKAKKDIVAKARRDGICSTGDGRIRSINHEHITCKDAPGRRAAQERIAFNNAIQGTAADVIKRAMVWIDTLLFSMVQDYYNEFHYAFHETERLLRTIPGLAKAMAENQQAQNASSSSKSNTCGGSKSTSSFVNPNAFANSRGPDVIRNDDCFLLMQVHDELVFSIRRSKLVGYASCIKWLMENAKKLVNVDLPVKVHVGANYGQLTELEIDLDAFNSERFIPLDDLKKGRFYDEVNPKFNAKLNEEQKMKKTKEKMNNKNKTAENDRPVQQDSSSSENSGMMMMMPKNNKNRECEEEMELC